MRIHCKVAALMLLLGCTALAKNESLEELRTRADNAHGADQAKFSIEYAQAELEHANYLFAKGDVDEAQAAVGSVMDYVRKGAQAATSSGKRLKQTEIELRKLEHRMKDIGASLNIDDRPPVMKDVDEIEQVRSGLLTAMWGTQAEPKTKP